MATHGFTAWRWRGWRSGAATCRKRFRGWKRRWRERFPPGTEEAVARLAGLYLRSAGPEQAKDLTLGLLKTNDLDFLPGIVQAFTDAGQPAQIREWLRGASLRSRDPSTRFLLQEQWLQKDPAAPAGPPAEFAREMRRLRKFGQTSPALKVAYGSARCSLARQYGARLAGRGTPARMEGWTRRVSRR